MDAITIFLSGFVLALGGMTAYCCVTTVIKLTPELIDAIKLWLWRRKNKSADEE